MVNVRPTWSRRRANSSDIKRKVGLWRETVKKGTGTSLIGFQDSKLGKRKWKVKEIDEKIHNLLHELLI